MLNLKKLTNKKEHALTLNLRNNKIALTPNKVELVAEDDLPRPLFGVAAGSMEGGFGGLPRPLFGVAAGSMEGGFGGLPRPLFGVAAGSMEGGFGGLPRPLLHERPDPLGPSEERCWRVPPIAERVAYFINQKKIIGNIKL
jgi:hypothetical protein